MGERISSYVSPFKHKDSISRFSEAIEKFREEKAKKMVRSSTLIPMFKNKVVDQEIISEMADEINDLQ